MKQFDKEFKKILLDSWVIGDIKKCCKRIKELIGKEIDNFQSKKKQITDKILILSEMKEELKKRLGIK